MKVMNSKLIIIGLMISSLLAISVSGQQLTNIQVILQDDKSGDHLLFAIPNGEYKFENCKGDVSIVGKGSVSVTGCTVVLQDTSDTRRVLAEVNLCDRAGKADIAFESDSLTGRTDLQALDFVISDSNTGDSAFSCESKTMPAK